MGKRYFGKVLFSDPSRRRELLRVEVGPGLDFRWILGFQVVPIGTQNQLNLDLFFDMVAQQCQRHRGHPLGMHLGPVVDP